ncbi:MAG: ATP-binding protein [Chlamydiae bacterium]|nr:ATP-binding protein [Chlamydiota bacterium]
MKRLIDWHLNAWKSTEKRKPLLLKGARQIGKTYAVRQLGKQFESFVEVNFELIPEAKTIFMKNLEPKRILWELSLLTNKAIIPGKSLLFLDEVQVEPQIILALRYFYELMPELHVIAAGSLLEFAIEQVGVPVGRITMLYVYPLSFMEFLAATDNSQFVGAILTKQPFSEILHNKLLDLLGQYLAIGGMPAVIQAWNDTKDPKLSCEAQNDLVESYRLDFSKYAKKHQLPCLNIFFDQICHFIGSQFKYSEIHGDYKKRELAPCLELLHKANIIYPVRHTAGNGLPLGAEVNLNRFKILMLDVGIAQNLLGLDLVAWFLNPDKELINRGPIVEAFVGQELLTYSSPKSKKDLFFWKRESSGAQSEIDYLYDYQHTIVPVEVKSGHGSSLRSLHQFLLEHKKCNVGIRFWAENYLMFNQVDSRPLYAVATLAHPDQIEALQHLV